MDTRISKVNWGVDGSVKLEFNKQAIVEASANLYRWIIETEERAMVEVLALNSGKDALLRLRKVIDSALEMAAKVESGAVDLQQPTAKAQNVDDNTSGV